MPLLVARVPGPQSHGPGTYTYRLDAARVLFDVYVMGADVNIPWLEPR